MLDNFQTKDAFQTKRFLGEMFSMAVWSPSRPQFSTRAFCIETLLNFKSQSLRTIVFMHESQSIFHCLTFVDNQTSRAYGRNKARLSLIKMVYLRYIDSNLAVECLENQKSAHMRTLHNAFLYICSELLI